MSDQAFLDGYDGVEVELPSGDKVICTVLTTARTAHYMRLYQQADAGDAKAMVEIVEKFPEEVGLGEAKLTAAELFDVVRGFFSAKRPKRPANNGAEPASPPATD